MTFRIQRLVALVQFLSALACLEADYPPKLQKRPEDNRIWATKPRSRCQSIRRRRLRITPSGPSQRDFEFPPHGRTPVCGDPGVGRLLEEDHESALSPAGPVLAGLDRATANESCLRSANQCAVRSSHSRGTFVYAFLSLEVEIKAIDGAQPACPGPMDSRPQLQRPSRSAAQASEASGNSPVQQCY
jgi:hypothetical protein